MFFRIIFVLHTIFLIASTSYAQDSALTLRLEGIPETVHGDDILSPFINLTSHGKNEFILPYFVPVLDRPVIVNVDTHKRYRFYGPNFTGNAMQQRLILQTGESGRIGLSSFRVINSKPVKHSAEELAKLGYQVDLIPGHYSIRYEVRVGDSSRGLLITKPVYFEMKNGK